MFTKPKKANNNSRNVPQRIAPWRRHISSSENNTKSNSKLTIIVPRKKTTKNRNKILVKSFNFVRFIKEGRTNRLSSTGCIIQCTVTNIDEEKKEKQMREMKHLQRKKEMRV